MYNSEVWHEREGDNGEGDPRALLEGGSLTRVRPPNLESSYVEVNLVLPSIILYIVLDLH